MNQLFLISILCGILTGVPLALALILAVVRYREDRARRDGYAIAVEQLRGANVPRVYHWKNGGMSFTEINAESTYSAPLQLTKSISDPRK